MKIWSLSLFIFFCVIKVCNSQIHSEWKLKDISLFDTLNSIINNPQKVEHYFLSHPKRNTKDSLGFGWLKVNSAAGGGYISIWAEFIYYRDTLKTYTLKSYLPDEDLLKDEYKSLYLKLLPLDSGDFFSYKWMEKNILHPLEAFPNMEIPDITPIEILRYMSPGSGIEYGYRGGIAMSLLENRKNFNQIKNSLTEAQVIIIMYSINPASRLTAIEYYLRNKKKFHKSKNIDAWIQRVFSELPKVKTMSGCTLRRESSSYLVQYFLSSSQK